MKLTSKQTKLLTNIKKWIKIESTRKLNLEEKLKVSNMVDDFESTGAEFPWDEIEKELGLNA